MAKPHCLQLLAHNVLCALAFAFDSAGRSIPARIAIIAITTNNSIKVNAWRGPVRLPTQGNSADEKWRFRAFIVLVQLGEQHFDNISRHVGQSAINAAERRLMPLSAVMPKPAEL